MLHVLLPLLHIICLVSAQTDKVLSRVVNTKYGRVQGFVRHHATPSLPPIEVFLGVPYASPPTGDGRFTPTSSPLPWDSLKKCLQLPPVCPQPMPDVEYSSDSVPPDRMAYLKSLRHLLQRQSEDCLYLNIYTPHDGGGQYPVMVFIQGEAFWWGSGNLYDGGVLASYGNVVVVTVNYRLGPLGFLNASPSGSTHKVVGNQGLLDQLAALSWVHENIAYFGGDSTKVTLIGHGAGAACVSYLMVSPALVPGFFQRVILMSGSAFSEWAEVDDGVSVTASLAKALNCSLPSDLRDQHPETIACLRNMSAQALVNAPLHRYKFASLFGPSVDGVVITQDFKMRIARELKGRNVSIMLGVTEGDAYPELSRRQAVEGLTIKERNQLFRTFVRNSYQHHMQEIFLAMAKEYTNWGNPSHHPIEVRDLTVEALSDGGYVAPMMRIAEMVSHARADTYMYVFTHHDKDHQRLGSVYASELGLMFGAPFHDPGSYPLPMSVSSSNPSRTSSLMTYRHSASNSFEAGGGKSQEGQEFEGKNVAWVAPSNFSRNDALVSEIIMKLWTNFARTGSPNSHEQPRPNLSYPEKSRFRNITWERFDPNHKQYLEISSRPRVRDHYRAHKVALWNWLFPELQDASRRLIDATEHTFTSPLPVIPSPHDEYYGPNVSAAHGKNPLQNIAGQDGMEKGLMLDYTTALTLTVAIGLSLLVLNVILFAALLYRKDRHQMGTKLNYDSVSVQPLCTVDSGLRSGSGHDTMTPPGKEIMSTCTADIQVTELHTFPTPPDIGDRNTEVTTYGSSDCGKRLTCGAIMTNQFVPPPPLLTAGATARSGQLEGDVSTTAGVAISCGSGGVVGSPCTGGSCYTEDSSSASYGQQSNAELCGSGGYSAVHRSTVESNPNYPINVGCSSQQIGSIGPTGSSQGGCSSACSTTPPKQGPSFPPVVIKSYCAQSQYYSNDYPTRYTPERYASSPVQQASSTCPYSSERNAVPGSILGIRGSSTEPGGVVRSSTLCRTGQSSASNTLCIQSQRKPKPPPRDNSSNPAFSTLPRQSPLDTSSHIVA